MGKGKGHNTQSYFGQVTFIVLVDFLVVFLVCILVLWSQCSIYVFLNLI